jgi:protein-S-isoprenylcysteine O-methyltransferase Ste14
VSELHFRLLGAAIVILFTLARRGKKQRWRSTHADAPVRRVDRGEKLLLAATLYIGRGIAALWLLTPWLDRFSLGAAAPVRLVGVGLALLGIVLLAWVHKTLGDNWSPSLEIRRGHELVERGPYALVRHPMYTAIGCALLGYAILSGNALVLFASPVPFAILVVSRLSSEEALLRERFGDDYLAYARRTKRLLPFVF